MDRQSISAGNSLSGESSIFNDVRSMSTKLLIGGLHYTTDDQSLKEAFSSFGEVEFVKVIRESTTGRSKGFGFLKYHTDEEANAAVAAMDGKELNGRIISVSHVEERK